MMKKTTFVKIMNTLRDYWDELSADMNRLCVVFEDNHLTRVFDKTMDALCEDLEGNLEIDPEVGPWCYYFAFELDWGRRDMAKDCVEIDGVRYALETPEQLYDLLMLLNDKEREYE
jgi:hypothetical protein